MRTEKGSIVGCYTLDLYCAIDHSPLGYEFYETNFGQFTGRTESSCIRAAKKAGWTVTRHNVLCPQHASNKASSGLAGMLAADGDVEEPANR